MTLLSSQAEIPAGRPDRRGAFTLIETLAVAAIIGVLLAMVLGTSSYVRRKADESRACAELETLNEALAKYAELYGVLPGAAPDGNATNLASTAVTNWLPAGYDFADPWKSHYRYIRHGDRSCTVLSMGPDMIENTPDDIRPGN